MIRDLLSEFNTAGCITYALRRLKLIYGGQPTGKLAPWDPERPNLKIIGATAHRHKRGFRQQ